MRLLESESRGSAEIDAGLRRIDREHLLRAGRRYAAQYARYAAELGARAEEHQFEVVFGEPGADGLPGLVLGREPDAVQLQGKIDRIDVVRLGDEVLFRVIDYKTGWCPGVNEVDAGLALQLPLYALAVEQVILAGANARPLDVGYWALAAKGYRSVKTMARLDGDGVAEADGWDDDRRALEGYVLALVARLRSASFPIAPRSDDCTRTCDYRAVCRIQQVRAAGKVWVDAPRMERSR